MSRIVKYNGWCVLGDEYPLGTWGYEGSGSPVIVMHSDKTYMVHPFNDGNDPLKPPLAGPFDTLDAAKAAYVIVAGVSDE